jgi:hypothetical protein
MQLRLELDLDGEPVSGQVGLSHAEPRDFIGYAALIATLHSIRAEESECARGAAPVEGSSSR